MMGWPDFLQAQSEQPYFRDLQSQLQAARAQGQLVYPPEAMIFRAFDLTPFDAVRVVILAKRGSASNNPALPIALRKVRQ